MIYLIAFLSPFFYALSVLIESFLSLDIFKKPMTMVFYASLTNALFVPVMFCFGMPTWPKIQFWIIYAVLAMIDIAYLYPYYIALKKTDTSVVSSLFAIGKIFIPLLSFCILGDILTPLQYMGFLIVIFSSAFLSMKKGFSFTLNKAFYLMLLSSFLLSCRVVLAKYTLGADGIWVNTIIYPNLISGVMVFLFLLVKDFRPDICKHLHPYMKRFPLFLANEFVYFWAILTSIYALSKLSPVISAVIEATEPIFLLFLVWLLQPFYHFQFKELNVSFVKKMFCFSLMILGIIFIS